jgi:PIN domain nuclease of toxin-antitoxin system
MYLQGTHLLLWAAFEPERLSAKATKLLRSRATPMSFSLATLWEVAIKASLGRPGVPVDPHREGGGPALGPARSVHRPLVAKAMEERMTLLSVDATLKRYGRFVRVV